MGYLTIPDASDVARCDKTEEELTIAQEKQKCFMVLDFDTRFIGILAGYDFEQATTMPFTKIKGARSVGRSTAVRSSASNKSDCASNQSQFWTLEFQLELENQETNTFLAKTKKERHLWIDGFSKAVELG